MTEQTEITSTEPVVSDELAEVIQELEQYRERLLNETFDFLRIFFRKLAHFIKLI